MTNRLLGVLAVLAAIGVAFAVTVVALVATRSGGEYEGQSFGERLASVVGADSGDAYAEHEEVMSEEAEEVASTTNDMMRSDEGELVDFLASAIEDGQISDHELEVLREWLYDAPEVFTFRDFDSFDETFGAFTENPFIDNRSEWERHGRGERNDGKTDRDWMKGDDDDRFKREFADKPRFEAVEGEYRVLPHEYFNCNDAEWLKEFLEKGLMKDEGFPEWLDEMKEGWEGRNPRFSIERRFEFADDDAWEWLEEFMEERVMDDEFEGWLEGSLEEGLLEPSSNNSFEFDSDDGRFRFRGEWWHWSGPDDYESDHIENDDE